MSLHQFEMFNSTFYLNAKRFAVVSLLVIGYHFCGKHMYVTITAIFATSQDYYKET